MSYGRGLLYEENSEILPQHTLPFYRFTSFSLQIHTRPLMVAKTFTGVRTPASIPEFRSIADGSIVEKQRVEHRERRRTMRSHGQPTCLPKQRPEAHCQGLASVSAMSRAAARMNKHNSSVGLSRPSPRTSSSASRLIRLEALREVDWLAPAARVLVVESSVDHLVRVERTCLISLVVFAAREINVFS